MRKHVPQGVTLALLGVCRCDGADPLDARLKPMIGSDEATLIAAVHRPPDGRIDPAPGLARLQWCWGQTYDMPIRQLAYSYAGGTIKPVANTAGGMVRDACVVQWTVKQGVATTYRREGACGLAIRALGLPGRRD